MEGTKNKREYVIMKYCTREWAPPRIIHRDLVNIQFNLESNNRRIKIVP